MGTSIRLSDAPITESGLSSIELAGAPLSAVPLSAVMLGNTPLSAVPLSAVGGTATDWCALLAEVGEGYDCSTGVDLGTTTIRDLSVRGVPLSAVPLSAVPLSAVAGGVLGAPLSAVPLSAVPLSAVSLSAVPLSAVNLQGTALAGIAAGAPPLSAVPLSAVDVAGSPLSAVPLSAVDVAGSPLSAVPMSAVPLSAVPSDCGVVEYRLDVAGSPLSAVPFSAVDIVNSPLSAVPLSAVTLPGIDCSLVNCEQASLGEAFLAGAVDPTITMLELQPFLSGVRLGALLPFIDGADPLVVAQSFASQGLLLGSLAPFDDMVLGDIPSRLFGSTTLGDLESGLFTVRLGDLIGALIDPATGAAYPDADVSTALRDALARTTYQNLGSLETLGDVTIGELIVDGTALTLNDLEPVLGFITIESILDVMGGTADLDGLNLGDLSEQQFGQLTLADLFGQNITAFDTLLLGDLMLAIQAELAQFTLGDLLLLLTDFGSLGFGGFDFDQVDIDELPSDTVPPVTFAASLRSTSPQGRAYPVELEVSIPGTAAYVDGSAVVTVTDGGLPANEFALEPTISGSSLTWSLTSVGSGLDYVVTFDVLPTVTLGTTKLNGLARILGTDESAVSVAAVSVAEGLEPNDFAPPGFETTAIDPDTIYLTYIPDADRHRRLRVDAPGQRRAGTRAVEPRCRPRRRPLRRSVGHRGRRLPVGHQRC